MILRDAGLDFADQVRADVGSLRVNAAAHTGEQRDRRRTKGKTGQHGDHLGDLPALPVVKQKQQAQAQHAEADHTHAHDRAAAEGDVECAVQAGARGVGGTNVGLGGHLHADEACQAGAKRADGKRQRNQRACVFAAARHGQQNRHDDDEPGQARIFGLEKRHRSLGDVTGNAFHSVGANFAVGHPLGEEEGVQQGDGADDRDNSQDIIHWYLSGKNGEWEVSTVQGARIVMPQGGGKKQNG